MANPETELWIGPAIDGHVWCIYSIQSLQRISMAMKVNFPFAGSKQMTICNSSLTLAINEFMASNEATKADEYGEYEDWVEIYNYGTAPIYLGDLYLSDKADNPAKWKFPEISIQAGEYLLIWLDEDGEQGDLHATLN
jgi:hypothetical protein